MSSSFTYRTTIRRAQRLSVACIGGAAVVYAQSRITRNRLHTEPEQATTSALDYSQHAQVSMSWQNPGCYLWGSNRRGVADPTSGESTIKAATRLSAFDGMALRDVKVSEDMGVAVLDSGDVCQWGTSYFPPVSRKKRGSPLLQNPEVTLAGKDIVKVELGARTIYALSRDGKVYSIPFTKQEQSDGPKAQESYFFGLRSSPAKISYRPVELAGAVGSKVSDIAAGKDHLLLLTAQGTIYATSDSIEGNAKGQMAGKTTTLLPSEFFRADQITGFKNAPAVAIACGDHHSIVLDADGEVFTFGSNTHGQLAFDLNTDSNNVDTPTMVSVSSLYPRNFNVKCLKIAGGGKNTYMVIQNQQYNKPNSTKIDIWASGMGQFGQLGNNTWNHFQGKPVKLKVISGLTEWDETNHVVRPIGVHSLSVGSTHIVCCLDNYSKVDAEAASNRTSFHDVNYGRDVFVWGGNQDFQIGNGKRNNRPMPEYISPMEASATELAVKSGWEEEGHKRFQLTPSKYIEITTSTGKRVKRNVEQAIIAGDRISCCYMKLVD